MLAKLLTDTELCEQLVVSRSTLWHLRKSSNLPFRRIGRSIRYVPDEIEQWLETLAIDKPEGGE